MCSDGNLLVDESRHAQDLMRAARVLGLLLGALGVPQRHLLVQHGVGVGGLQTTRSRGTPETACR